MAARLIDISKRLSIDLPKKRTTLRVSKIKGLSKYDDKEKIDWKGYYKYYGYFFVDYLNQNYSNVCAFKNFNFYFPGRELNFLFGQTITKVNGDSLAKKKFFSLVNTCKKRFIIFPTTIFQHENIIIYDTVLKEIELFDSYCF